jgi:hypothetical protein
MPSNWVKFSASCIAYCCCVLTAVLNAAFPSASKDAYRSINCWPAAACGICPLDTNAASIFTKDSSSYSRGVMWPSINDERASANYRRGRMTIPEGLFTCPVCGMYRGTTIEAAGDGSGHSRKSTCVCDGVLCNRCGVNKVLRPGSNVFSESTGRWEHMPILPGLPPCWQCHLQENTQRKNRKRI